MFPLTKKFRATGLLRAFFLNSLVSAAIVVFGIAIRRLLDNEKGRIYGYVNTLYGTTRLSELQIIITAFITTFFGAFIVYLLMYAIFYYGGNLLIRENKPMPW